MSNKEMRLWKCRRTLAASLVLLGGAAIAGAQESAKAGAEAIREAPQKVALRYEASGGFAQVLDRMQLQADGSLVASREFLGKTDRVRAFLQPEEVLGLMKRFPDWARRTAEGGGKGEVTYKVSLVRNEEETARSTREDSRFLTALRDLHRKALAGDLAGPGEFEAALPIGPEGSKVGFTVKEREIRYWHLTADGQRLEDHRRKLSAKEHAAIKSVLDVSLGGIQVVPVAEDDDPEVHILPIEPEKRSTLERFRAVLQILRG